MSGEVEVKGLQELGQALSLLGSEMGNKIARQATGAAAQVIKKRAQEIVKVADEAHMIGNVLVPRGTVRDNIITKKIKSQLTSEHIVTVRGGAKNAYASRIGSILEYGTVNMSARSFMRPAFLQSGEKAKDAMVAKIKAGIEKANK